MGSSRCTGKYHMIYAGLGITAVALAATAAVASAQAQTQTETPGRTVWDHNGSVMYLVANGSSREFYYQKPRPGMLDAGARPGSLLFRGQLNSGQYSGTAYFFNPLCGAIPFEVKGPILEDEERIVLTGQAPRVRAKLSHVRLLYKQPGIPAIKIRRGKSNPRSRDRDTGASVGSVRN